MKTNLNFRYLTFIFSKNGLTIQLTKEGKEFIKDFDATFDDLFDEVRGNSELIYFEDIGEAGFGLTSAEGITDGYYYDDKGNITDKGHKKDSAVYWYPNYMIVNFFEELQENGETFFNKA